MRKRKYEHLHAADADLRKKEDRSLRKIAGWKEWRRGRGEDGTVTPRREARWQEGIGCSSTGRYQSRVPASSVSHGRRASGYSGRRGLLSFHSDDLEASD